MTNLSTRSGDYASTGKPLFALVDSRSFYVMGYFEETKLRHIREGAPALITLYSGNIKLQGHVSSIGRAIYDQSVESDSGLIPDIKPNVPWVRLAQRVPVRIEFDALPHDVTLVSGTTCSVSIGQQNETASPDAGQFTVVESHLGTVALRAAKHHRDVPGVNIRLLPESG